MPRAPKNDARETSQTKVSRNSALPGGRSQQCITLNHTTKFDRSLVLFYKLCLGCSDVRRWVVYTKPRCYGWSQYEVVFGKLLISYTLPKRVLSVDCSRGVVLFHGRSRARRLTVDHPLRDPGTPSSPLLPAEDRGSFPTRGQFPFFPRASPHFFFF